MYLEEVMWEGVQDQVKVHWHYECGTIKSGDFLTNKVAVSFCRITVLWSELTRFGSKRIVSAE